MTLTGPPAVLRKPPAILEYGIALQNKCRRELRGRTLRIGRADDTRLVLLDEGLVRLWVEPPEVVVLRVAHVRHATVPRPLEPSAGAEAFVFSALTCAVHPSFKIPVGNRFG